MPDEIQVGDTVRLKSGGPTMTVDKVGDDREAWACGAGVVRCVWFHPSEQTVQRESFPLVILNKV